MFSVCSWTSPPPSPDAATPPESAPGSTRRGRRPPKTSRHVCGEFDDDAEAAAFHDDLNARLDELERTEDFLDVPIDDLIAKLCQDLGFEPPEPAEPPL